MPLQNAVTLAGLKALVIASLLWQVAPIGGAALTYVVVDLADSGPGSLRQAILDANATFGGDIVFSNVTGSIYLESPLPPILGSATVSGPGSSLLRITASNIANAFSISYGASCSISGLTIGNFGGPINQSSILNGGTLLIANCAFSNNYTYSAGAAISSGGNLDIRQTIFSGNRAIPPSLGAPSRGGALVIGSGRASLSNCTFIGNSTYGGDGQYTGVGAGDGNGGAILMLGGELVIAGCMFQGNSVAGGMYGGNARGGALYVAGGTVRIRDSTFAENRAETSIGGATLEYGRDAGNAQGAGIYVHDGLVEVASSTFVGNTIKSGEGGTARYGAGGPGLAQGAGIFAEKGTINLINDTYSGNRTQSGNAGIAYRNNIGGCAAYFGGPAYGAGIFVSNAVVSVINCTLTANQAVGGPGTQVGPCVPGANFSGPGRGGGLATGGGAVSLLNTIIAGNTGQPGAFVQPGAPDVYGSLTSQGFNLIENTNGATGFLDIDFVSMGANLGSSGKLVPNTVHPQRLYLDS